MELLKQQSVPTVPASGSGDNRHPLQGNCLTALAVAFRCLLATVVLFGAASLSAVETAKAPEYSVKAAFIMNFIRYTTWPESAFATQESPLIIGVLGNNPFDDVLVKTAQRQLGSRRIEVRSIDSATEASVCHLVFIGESERKNEEAWIAALKGKPILVIGESGQTIKRGGALEFIIVKERVRFEASMPAMKAAGIKCSSEMLRYARTVYRTNDGSQ